MKGPPCHFHVTDNAVPTAMRGHRAISEPLMPLLKEELETFLTQDIIQKVTKPTPWVNPIVIAPKKNGIRHAVDFHNLNRYIIRPVYDAATPFQAARMILGMTEHCRAIHLQT